MLTAKLYDLRRQERHLVVEFLLHLGELDRRKLYLELGFSSLFAFCTDHLGLSKGATYRRITATRLLARFPVVAEHLADGRLSLTTLVLLKDVLVDESVDEVLARAAGRREDEVERLVAASKPREAPPALLRRLPTAPAPEPERVSSGPEPLIETSVPAPAAPDPPEPRRTTASVAPIAPATHVLRLTVTDDFVADLNALRDALSHTVPSG